MCRPGARSASLHDPEANHSLPGRRRPGLCAHRDRRRRTPCDGDGIVLERDDRRRCGDAAAGHVDPIWKAVPRRHGHGEHRAAGSADWDPGRRPPRYRRAQPHSSRPALRHTQARPERGTSTACRSHGRSCSHEADPSGVRSRRPHPRPARGSRRGGCTHSADRVRPPVPAEHSRGLLGRAHRRQAACPSGHRHRASAPATAPRCCPTAQPTRQPRHRAGRHGPTAQN